jgi:hypothetical protein
MRGGTQLSYVFSSRGCSAWRSWARDLVLLGGEVRFFTGISSTDRKHTRASVTEEKIIIILVAFLAGLDLHEIWLVPGYW